MSDAWIGAGRPDAADAAAILVLGERLDLTAAAPLAAAIRTHRDRPIRLDAGAVSHLGGLCLQVLLAAAADWRARGLGWSVAPRSRTFDQALEVFAIAPGRIGAEPGAAPAADMAEARP